MTLLRIRAVQIALAVLMVATPKPYRRELETCFNRLDAEAQVFKRAPGQPQEVIQ